MKQNKEQYLEKAYLLEKEFQEQDPEKVKLVPGNEWVLVKQLHASDKTKSGLYIPESSDSIVDRTPRMLEVIKHPETLLFAEDYPHISMQWDTDVEIQEGDVVWSAYDAVTDSPFRFKDKRDNKYYFVKYRDLFIAKRGDQIIPLNGYCIFEYIKAEKEKKGIVVSLKETDERYGIVVHTGSKNKRYIDPSRSDNIDLNEGDKVIFRNPNLINVKLESYLFKFFGENLNKTFLSENKEYRVAQRHHVLVKV